MKSLNLQTILVACLIISTSCAKKDDPKPSAPVEAVKPSQDDVSTPPTPADAGSSATPDVSGTHILLPKPPVAPAGTTPVAPEEIKPHEIRTRLNSNIGQDLRDTDDLNGISIGLGPNGTTIVRRQPKIPNTTPEQVSEDGQLTAEDLFNPKPGHQISSPQARSIYDELNDLSHQDDREEVLINNDQEILAKIDALKKYRNTLFIGITEQGESKFIKDEITRIEASLGKPLEHLRKIDAAIENLKEVGFELELYENEYRWREREVTDEFGTQATWSIHLINLEGKYIEISAKEILIIIPRIRHFSDSVGDYGKSFKSLMNAQVLSRWRTINPLLRSTDNQIRERLQN